MTSATVPMLLRRHIEEGILHVFFLQNPVALIMSLMIADAYEIPTNRIVGVSIRQTDTTFTGFAELPLRTGRFDRYINRLSGRNLAGVRLRRELERLGQRYIVYASWHYAEVEEVTASRSCVGMITVEEGQLSYYNSLPYPHTFGNRWRFRKKRIAAGTPNLYFREDAAAFIGLSPDSFPGVPKDKRFVLDNLAVAAQRYRPQLMGRRSIGLMPAPSRLAPSDVLPAIEKLAKAMGGSGTIKMHPGYRSERYYSEETFSRYLHSVADGRITLCPESVIIELEMLSERKRLFGSRTSLSRYAKMFGSSFVQVEFDGYIPPTN